MSYHAFADAGSACRTAFGSAAYHWAPGNGLLVVDRLPMALWLKLPVRGTDGLRNTRWWAVLGLFGAAKLMVLADHPVFDVAKRAFSRAFGKPTVFMREGGSIPFVRTIADATGKPCLLMGFGQPDENAHAPNEWLDLENFHLGIKSAAYLYDELSRLAP